MEFKSVWTPTALAACSVLAVSWVTSTTLVDRAVAANDGAVELKRHVVAQGDLAVHRRRGDLQAQRQHAWNVVADVTQAVDGNTAPAFASWRRSVEVFAATSPEEADEDRALPIGEMTAAHGATTQSAEPQIIIFTLYNEAAYRHIRDNNLHERAELERLRSRGPQDPIVPADRSIPPFHSDAMVLLTAWWPVARDRRTALPVWDPELNPPVAGGNSYITWRRAVAIDPAPDRDAPATVRIEFAGRQFPNAPRHSLDTFHHIIVDEEMAERTRQNAQAHKAAVIALGRGLQAGDYLALVAVHIATRDLDDWVWATLWWHDRAEQGEFAQGRPATLQGPWRNYLLDVAFDAELPLASDRGPRVCFNPWLEARFPDEGGGGGTLSNCVACHSRASFPPVSFLPVTRGAPDLINDPAYAPGRLRTDFLWSLARQANSRALSAPSSPKHARSVPHNG